MTTLRILGRVTSINVRKVLWVADLAGLPYTREDWGMPVRDPKVPEFLRLNPNGQVPVIVEDETFVLWESGAVMRYFAEVANSDLWPKPVRERGLVDQWLTWQATELNPTWGYAVYALLRKEPGFDDPAKVEESRTKWTARMQLLEGHLAGAGGFMANGRLSLADIAIALSSHRWFQCPIARPELPAVTAHYDMLRQTPEGQRYIGADTF
jgi:glutathione S-transferase